jgi:hypothetical protein
MYIVAPEPVPKVYFINTSHQSMCVSPHIVARQRLDKRLRGGNEILLDASDSMRSVSYQRNLLLLSCYFIISLLHVMSLGHIFWGCFYFKLSSYICALVYPRVSCTFILSHRGECCDTTETHCIFNSILITLASRMQLSTVVCYSSPNPPPSKGNNVFYFICLIKCCIIDVNRSEMLLHCIFRAVRSLSRNY